MRRFERTHSIEKVSIFLARNRNFHSTLKECPFDFPGLIRFIVLKWIPYRFKSIRNQTARVQDIDPLGFATSIYHVQP